MDWGLEEGQDVLLQLQRFLLNDDLTLPPEILYLLDRQPPAH